MTITPAEAEKLAHELIALAEKATPGPWYTHDWNDDNGHDLTTVEAHEQLSVHDSIWPNGIRKHRVAETIEGDNPLMDAAYIAAANPSAITTLCRAYLDTLKATKAKPTDDDERNELIRLKAKYETASNEMRRSIDRIANGDYEKLSHEIRVSICNSLSDSVSCEYPHCSCHGDFKARLDRIVPCVKSIIDRLTGAGSSAYLDHKLPRLTEEERANSKAFSEQIVKTLRIEAKATEELHPDDSEIDAMREAAHQIEFLEGEIDRLSSPAEPYDPALNVYGTPAGMSAMYGGSASDAPRLSSPAVGEEESVK